MAGGGFVVTYSERNPTTFERELKAQRFDSFGNKVGPEISVNETPTGTEIRQMVAGLSNGGFAVFWEGYFEANTAQSHQGRIFDASGTPVTSEIDIPVTLVGGVFTSNPVVTALTNGGFVMTYERSTTSLGHRARVYDNDGTLINDVDIGADSATFPLPVVSALPNGNFAVSWSVGNSVMVKLFTATGTPLISDFVAGSNFNSSIGATVIAPSTDGGFVVGGRGMTVLWRHQPSTQSPTLIQCWRQTPTSLTLAAY